MGHHPSGSSHTGVPASQQVARQAEELAKLLRQLPAAPAEWLTHPLIGTLFAWASAVAGRDVALDAIEYLQRHIASWRASEISALHLRNAVARNRRDWFERSNGVRRDADAARRTTYVVVDELAAPAGHEPLPGTHARDDAWTTRVVAFVAAAIGHSLSPAAADVLADAALVAVDLANTLRAHGARDPLAAMRCGGSGGAHNRLATVLAGTVADRVARRSVARMLVGTQANPAAALLLWLATDSTAGRAIPAHVRAAWAADALDFDPATRLSGPRRDSARRAAKARAHDAGSAAPVARDLGLAIAV